MDVGGGRLGHCEGVAIGLECVGEGEDLVRSPF